MIILRLAAIALGFGLDFCFGDPIWLPHPIRWLGKLIESSEIIIRRFFPKTSHGELIGGLILVFWVTSLAWLIPILILSLLNQYSSWLAFMGETLMCYQILAARSLQLESEKVYRALKTQDLVAGQRAVAMIVGRDTQSLDELGVIKATVETVAENTSDAVVAPLLFLVLGGAPLGFFYKAVNTLDSMIGYKNDKFHYFGRAAAKLDDLLNFIPARIAGALMVVTAYILGLNGAGAWRILKRDRLNHQSPNSAHTEAACAGALSIELAGDAYYFGELHHKAKIGDSYQLTELEDILRSNRLMYGTALLTLISVIGISLFIGKLGGWLG